MSAKELGPVWLWRTASAIRAGGIAATIGGLMTLAASLVMADQRQAAGPADVTPSVVKVSAGEHGEFSRVVLRLGAAAHYLAEPAPGALRVVFPDTRLDFDYRESEIVRRARRVVRAGAERSDRGSAFVLAFGCACTPRTLFYDGKLVIDVFDARHRDEASSRGPSSSTDDLRRSRQGFEPPKRPDAALAARAPAPMPDPALPGPDAAPRPEFLRRVEALAEPAPLAPRGPALEQPDFDPEPLRRMLAEAIERGHLNAVGSQAPSPEDRQIDGAAPAPEIPPPARDESTGEDPPLQAAATVPAAACPDGDLLDPAAGYGKGSFSAALAARQDRLGRALEAEEGVEAARLALASFYIARLMPQEALAVMAELPGDPSNPATVAWLRAIALALADRSEEISKAHLEPGCEGADVAVWRATISAARDQASRALLEAPEIATRLTTYPEALRTQLGLRLATAALDAGLPEPAGGLLNMVEQAGPEDAELAKLLFLKGRLAALRGDYAGAGRAWQEAARLPGEGGARARLALLRAALDRGERLPAEVADLLAGLAFDWRGHPLQLEVAQLAATLHERAGRPLDALEALDQVALGAPGRPKAGAAARLATDLLRRLYADPTGQVPAGQLAVFWRYEGFVPPGAEGADIRLGFARALLAHDLPGPAAALLDPLTREAPARLRQEAIEHLVEARLRLGQPERALHLLRANTGQLPRPEPRWNALAARALAGLGRFAEAAGLLHDGTPDRDATAELADYLWQARLWAEAVPTLARVFDQAVDQGDEATAGRAARRAVAAAYMAGAMARRLDGFSQLMAAAGPAVPALLAGPPTQGGTRAAIPALLEQTDAVLELARTFPEEG